MLIFYPVKLNIVWLIAKSVVTFIWKFHLYFIFVFLLFFSILHGIVMVTMLYNRSLELFHLALLKLYIHWTISIDCSPELLANLLLLFAFNCLTIVSSSRKWNTAAFVLLLVYCPPGSSMLSQIAGFPFFKVEKYSIACIRHVVFNPSSVDSCLGCFHI